MRWRQHWHTKAFFMENIALNEPAHNQISSIGALGSGSSPFCLPNEVIKPGYIVHFWTDPNHSRTPTTPTVNSWVLWVKGKYSWATVYCIHSIVVRSLDTWKAFSSLPWHVCQLIIAKKNGKG